MSSFTTGSGGNANTRRLNTFLMSEDRWDRALKEHNTRVKNMKPAVDLKSPWGCSRPYVPLPPADGSGSARSARRSTSRTGDRPTSASSRNGNRPTSASSNHQHRSSYGQTNSLSGTTAAPLPQQRPGSALGAAGSRPSSAANQRPTSATSRASGYSSSGAVARGGGGGGSGGGGGGQVISHLPLQQQRLCEEMVKLLVGLDRERSKSVLEHLYANAEESRLLQSYSGVYPGLLHSAAGADGNNDGDSFENVSEM